MDDVPLPSPEVRASQEIDLFHSYLHRPSSPSHLPIYVGVDKYPRTPKLARPSSVVCPASLLKDAQTTLYEWKKSMKERIASQTN